MIGHSPIISQLPKAVIRLSPSECAGERGLAAGEGVTLGVWGAGPNPVDPINELAKLRAFAAVSS